ncbi:MAG: IS1634 family transposase [Bacteroidales bacterium]|nr:IS1634 family transposase [Bacteroidales bacterium]
MFVRRKRNSSGSTSIQVVGKADGKYRVLKTFGCSHDEDILSDLEARARQWSKEHEYGEELFAPDGAAEYDAIFAGIGQDQLRLVGPDLIYGRLFDKIGFGSIKTADNELFKSLVVTRLYHPGSKLKTLRYMAYFMNRFYDEDKVYRFLDNLCWRPEETVRKSRADVKREVERVTYEQTCRVLGGSVAVVFYDTTTMYFESREDDVRVPGWSKDGKSANPQIVLGLLVGPGGNPIGYEMHPGNTYEGHTMIPIIEKLRKRFGFAKPTVIADAGLLSKENIRDLENEGYEYILGSRIRSQSDSFKAMVASLGLKNGQMATVPLTGSRRMVVTMSDARARKNAADREKGLKRLEKRFRTDSLTKDKLNNRGYNRFLTLSGDASIRIDYDKVNADASLDGYKGYTTNSTMSDNQIVEQYGYLFMIERAFRFCKTDLDIRPMYHRLYNRIEAHVCICFVAYTIMLELERILKDAGSSITLDRARFLAEKIYQIDYVNPYDKKHKSVLLHTKDQPEVTELLGIIKSHL